MPRQLAIDLTHLWRQSLEPLRALPARARLWWLLIVGVSIALAPMCLSQSEPGFPLLGLFIAPVLNGLLVIATAPRGRQSTLKPTFDYGGIATLALLASFGPAAALCAFVGEKLASAFLPDASGQRPVWVKSVYNLAWGSPCIMLSWAVRSLAPEHSLEPALVAAAWWLFNGLLVGTMVALAQRRAASEGVRLAVTWEGWLRLQEAALSVLAVVALWTNPLLLVVVVLLVIGHAMTGQRLFREFERSAAAREQALLDPLTRMPNRRAFEEALEQVPAPQAALMLDLDHFKRVNDTFGHDVGDHVLFEVASAMQHTLGSTAFCARLGGEEFCALIAQVSGDAELVALAERVRHAVAALRFDGVPDLRSTVSIGVAQRLPHEVTVRKAIMRADRALYRAKHAGRDRVWLETSDALSIAS